MCISKETSTKTPSPTQPDACWGANGRASNRHPGHLPLTPRRNRYILLVTDYFAKWVEIFAAPNQTATTCVEVILNEVSARFGCPLSLHSDQGKNYESRVFAELCQLLEIQKTRTSAGNPRCNGQAECFNRTLLKMIKAYLKGEQRNWDKHLGCLAVAYRGTRHESTGLSPNLMMLGRETRMPAEVMCGQHTHGANETYGEYVHKLKERLQHTHDVARNHLHDLAKRQKQIYDARVKANQYEVGDLVWMETDIGQLDITPYEGLYMNWKQLGLLDYEVHMFHGNPKIVHHNRLKPYHGLKRPQGYHQALAEAKKNDPQPLSAIASWGQRVNPVFQSGQVCRQKGGPSQKESGVWGGQEGPLLSLAMGSPCRMAVLTQIGGECHGHQWINCILLSQSDVPVCEVWCQPEPSGGGGAALPKGAPEAVRGSLCL